MKEMIPETYLSPLICLSYDLDYELIPIQFPMSNLLTLNEMIPTYLNT